MALRSSNPAFNPEILNRERGIVSGGGTMTVGGTVNKTGLLLMIAIITAGYTWDLVLHPGGGATASGLMMLGVFGGFIVGLVCSFKPAWSPVAGPVYAALEGLFLGGLSAMYERRFPGIPTQAVCAAFGVLFIMLAIYRSGAIKVTDRFRMGIVSATLGVCLMYFVINIAAMFGVVMPFMYDASPVGILINLVVAGIAALNLILDFDFIERGAAAGAPRYMEWYGAFGLMVTLVWMYLEILRLLSRLQGSRS